MTLKIRPCRFSDQTAEQNDLKFSTLKYSNVLVNELVFGRNSLINLAIKSKKLCFLGFGFFFHKSGTTKVFSSYCTFYRANNEHLEIGGFFFKLVTKFSYN